MAAEDERGAGQVNEAVKSSAPHRRGHAAADVCDHHVKSWTGRRRSTRWPCQACARHRMIDFLEQVVGGSRAAIEVLRTEQGNQPALERRFGRRKEETVDSHSGRTHATERPRWPMPDEPRQPERARRGESCTAAHEDPDGQRPVKLARTRHRSSDVRQPDQR